MAIVYIHISLGDIKRYAHLCEEEGEAWEEEEEDDLDEEEVEEEEKEEE